jgi:hypothetical protein
MLYGIWRAFRLVVEQCDAQNAQYDVIIRYRFDLLCSDPKKILIDVNDVINESKFIKMPEHNWAKAADLFFDGVLIASFTTYSRILSSLHLEFNSRFLHLHEDENLFPELLIAESITSLRIKIKSTCAEFKLIRKDGLCEQVFTANSSILNRCISNYSLCEYLRRSRDGYVVKQLVRRCSNQTNIVFFVLARLFYPLIKIIKSLQSKV